MVKLDNSIWWKSRIIRQLVSRTEHWKQNTENTEQWKQNTENTEHWKFEKKNIEKKIQL